MRERSLALFVLVACMFVMSCTKEEEEVPRAAFTPSDLDIGHLIIKIDEISAGFDPSIHVAGIELINSTTGVTSVVTGNFSHVANTPPQLGFSYLSVPLAVGHTGDQVECCVTFDGIVSLNIGLDFKDVIPDSVTTTPSNSDVYCQTGVY